MSTHDVTELSASSDTVCEDADNGPVRNRLWVGVFLQILYLCRQVM